MCGATDEQKAIQADQMAFTKTLTDHYGTVFGQQQGILKALTDHFTPILKAGPNQRGFSTAERADLRTRATEATARGYDHAKDALGRELGAAGGDDFIPQGEKAQLSAELMSKAENERADLGQKIDLADYDEGGRHWEQATQVLGNVAHELNPNATAGEATGSGRAASDTANEIAEASNSMWNAAIGAVGGVAGAAVGGWAGKVAKPPK